MLHLISYLILKGVQFSYYPYEEPDEPNTLKFYGRDQEYVIHEFERDRLIRYSVLEYDGDRVLVSDVIAIELFDVVAALI